MFLCLFNSFASVKAPPDIVCLQDPPVWRSRLPSFHNFTPFYAPCSGGFKSRVAYYVSSMLLSHVTVLPLFSDHYDVAALDIYESDLFGGFFTQFRILNVYNLRPRHAGSMPVSPIVSFPEVDFPLLVVGDFNIHHPLSDPLRAHSSEELALSFPYFSRASELGFELLNLPGVFTRFPLGGSSCPSVIDLSFAFPRLASFCHHWDTSLPSTSSDHVPITITVSHPVLSPPFPLPNWVLTDWDSLTPLLGNLVFPAPPQLPTLLSLEAWFDRHLSTLISLLTSHTTVKRPSHRSNPWWSPLLTIFRRRFHCASRVARASRLASNYDAARLSKRGYFKAIRAAKSSHWKSLLTSATPCSIWAVKKMAVGRSPPRFPTLPDASTSTRMNDALLGHFFPPRPSRPLPSILRTYGDYMILSPDEVSVALASGSPTSAPGPDTISYSVWKAVHRIAPSVLTSLLPPLLRFGHHPSSLKKVNGVVLAKPGKPSYDSPSSFRIIVLLQTVSKILERIAASRLSAVARYIGLLNSNQCGSLPSLSSFDACSALVDTVRTLQCPGRKVSSLFLDMKGGFDNVDADILCHALQTKGVARYLVAWIKSFLSDRSCRLLFQGSPRVFSLVSVSNPQGSPISPLLFVIYVSPLHISLPRGLVLSYVDDFALTTSSLSYRTNSRSLQAAFGRIRAIAHARKIEFSVPQTELIHWRTPVQKDPPGTPRPPTVALDNQIFSPSHKLRWLSYWFVPNISSSSAHFACHLALSQAAFAAVRRLSSAGGGIPPYLCHRLAYSLLFPILSYGADLFVPTKGLLSKMDVYWRQVQGWVTNCFRTTPVPILSAESCLPPLHVLFSHKRRMAALRLVCSPPSIKPASARLCRSFPTLLSARASDSYRSLCTRLPPNVMPLNWRTPLPYPPVRSHLPVDFLAHLTLPLLEGLTFAPMINSLLLPDLPPLPDDATMLAA